MGYMYGSVADDGKVKVEFIYEPPQQGTASSFEILDDPMADRVAGLAALLRVKCSSFPVLRITPARILRAQVERVGWIFAHPPREDGFIFSGLEVITAAELQLEVAGGVNPTNFVTAKVTLDATGSTHVDAFQVRCHAELPSNRECHGML
jgi:nuclear protein localization family protein 4